MFLVAYVIREMSPERKNPRTESTIKSRARICPSLSFLFFFVRRRNYHYPCCLDFSLSVVTRCQLRHRRMELHTGPYFIGLSDFTRMRPFGLGSNILPSWLLDIASANETELGETQTI